MSETVTNLKVRFGADTKNFKADLESGKAAVNNFTGAASGAFNKFAELFGIDMSLIQGHLTATNKSLALLFGGFKGATAGAGLFSNALKILRLALISTGIGAIIVSLGSLVSYFTKTERGAEAVERVMASFKAIVNVLIDRFAILGEGIFQIFTGKFEAGWKTLKSSINGIGEELKTESKAARELAIALQKLEDKEIALIKVQAERKLKISELKLAAKDEEKSTKEQLAALSEAIRIQKQVTADEVAMQEERTRILEAQYKMGGKMDDQLRELNESKKDTILLDAQGNDEIRTMMREYNKLSKEVNAQTAALDKETQAVRLTAIEKEKAESKGFSTLSPIKLTADSKTGKIAEANIAAPIAEGFETSKLEASAAKIKSIYGDLQKTTVDVGALIAEAANSLAVSFGENLGLLLAGAEGAKGIGEILGSAFGDMLVTIGKATISAGTAFLAMSLMFQAGIATPGAAIAAIAAGIALVAIGSAFKSTVSSAGSSASYSSASSTSSYGSGVSSSGSASTIRSAPQTIYITGEFRQSGKDLVAIIDKNSQRKYITT